MARRILAYCPDDVDRLIEPFCGAAAVSLAAAAFGLSKRFCLNDLNGPLMSLWREILARPSELADGYEALWHEQHPNKKEFFFKVRASFNTRPDPHCLLYLLARIVKASVRYNSEGYFNQSADNRRSGMRPETMRRQLLGVSALLSDRTSLSSADFREVVATAAETDLVYMDPPFQGTSMAVDRRYAQGLDFDDFVDALILLNQQNVSFMVSYDGKTGEKTHGMPLPSRLGLKRLHLRAGRSSQATLLGKKDLTVESLYLSTALIERLRKQKATAFYRSMQHKTCV